MSRFLANDIVFLTNMNHYTTKARLRDIALNEFGIKEFYCVDTPSKSCGWSQSGFQLTAVHLQKDWSGSAAITGLYKNKTTNRSLAPSCKRTLPLKLFTKGKKLLELFSGTGSVRKVAERMGYIVLSLDLTNVM